MLKAYVGQSRTTGVGEAQLTEEFHTARVVGQVLNAGYREYDDYQDAVEQRTIAVERYERTPSLPARLPQLVMLQALRWQVAFMRRQWAKSLSAALSSQVRPTLRRLIGESHETLLVTPDLLGLIEVHDLRYVVPHRELQSLGTKMGLMDGGTIAISGPRGVGKSTLLKACEQSWSAADLVVPVQLPAAYVPQEFLLSLFQQVCERFLKLHGYKVDSSFLFLVKLRKHLTTRLRNALSYWVRLLVAVLLVAVAFAPVAHALRVSLGGSVYTWLSDAWGALSGTALRLWREHVWLTRIPLAALGLSLGATLLKRRRRSPLLKECVNYLYHLRTLQSTSLAANAGLTPFPAGNVGAGRTTTLSSRTFTLPELVTHFRELLERMAQERRAAAEAQNAVGRIFIIIDEVDRIGTAEKARALLAEIKAVFGIPNVYFLISVAEDVGADFIGRGLASRDILDSSLDDIVHVEPRTLEESRGILENRVPGLTAPFIALAHCLSGGITRDLIRYTRRMVQIPDQPDARGSQLPEVAGKLLEEELRETLMGFRVRLARNGVEGGWEARFDHIRRTVLRLQEQSVHGQASRTYDAVERLMTASATPPGTALGSEPGEQQPWAEVAAYCDFMLTLLGFFTSRQFPTSDVIQSVGPDGNLQRLAEARLELAVSPAGARLVLQRFREAWDSPPARGWPA
ncbi:P-loop NTPase fold protein [Streptomyces sp. NPDC101227]|uniref:P-loop NTPase fold protein n=1 Tax=Streptomyces sp. NPDC101227 TaxID=3366136 RepID=UPI0037FF64AC